MPSDRGLTPEALDTAARTVWGEARGEPWDGKVAVAWVIRNRADNPGWWGRNVAEVCLQPFQFSCWLHNDPNRVKCIQATEVDLRECRKAVEAVFDGTEPDITNGADHYHHKTILPRWATGEKPVAIIGDHKFYRLRDPEPAVSGKKE